MTLARYLQRFNVSRDDFAALIGVNRITVWRWETGQTFPIRHMAKITAATNGKVAPNDFYKGAE